MRLSIAISFGVLIGILGGLFGGGLAGLASSALARASKTSPDAGYITTTSIYRIPEPDYPQRIAVYNHNTLVAHGDFDAGCFLVADGGDVPIDCGRFLFYVIPAMGYSYSRGF